LLSEDLIKQNMQREWKKFGIFGLDSNGGIVWIVDELTFNFKTCEKQSTG
jgi:hypothetical protein